MYCYGRNARRYFLKDEASISWFSYIKKGDRLDDLNLQLKFVVNTIGLAFANH
jgi:hypothetical protein